MPRIYAPNENYKNDWAAVPADKGVLVLPEGANTDWFAANRFTVDGSKNVLTVLDELTPAQLRSLCGYLGITIDAGAEPDSKHALIRAVEGEISTKYIGAVTVASVAGTESGDTKINITGAGTYKYKTAAATAPSLLYLDYPDATWLDIATGDEFAPTATHDKIAVVKLDAKGYVTAIGTANIIVNNT